MPLRRAARKIRHLTRVTRCDPFVEVRRSLCRTERRHSDEIEAERSRAILDSLCEGSVAGSHRRVAQRAYCSTSCALGMKSGEPKAVSIRQRT